MQDDRKDFEIMQREKALALGNDTELRHAAFELQIDATRHSFTYLWNWLGVPIIQVPTDIVVMQELMWSARPDVIIETGVARGGSLILSASILQLLGRGSVLGIDIDIRSHNRETIESHPLAHRIKLIEGSSVAPETLEIVRNSLQPSARVMVILDSNHSYDHVLAELRQYAPLVTNGQWLVVADTALGIPEAERLHVRDWTVDNNPLMAVREYLRESERFEIDPVINGKLLLTSNPDGYLRCVRD